MNILISLIQVVAMAAGDTSSMFFMYEPKKPELE